MQRGGDEMLQSSNESCFQQNDFNREKCLGSSILKVGRKGVLVPVKKSPLLWVLMLLAV